MKRLRTARLLSACAGIALACAAAGALAQVDALPMIDTHTHLNFVRKGSAPPAMDFPASVAGALGRMDAAGFRRAIIMPQPSPPGAANAWEIERMEFALAQYPARIARGGGGGTLNPMIQATPVAAVDEAVRAKFRALAMTIADQGAVVFGEVTAHHLSLKAMGPQHAYQWVPADHPLLLLLADISAERGIPIDLHLDFVPEDMARPGRPIFNDKTPLNLKGNSSAFERLLAHNPKAVFVWAHAGTDPLLTRTLALQRALLAKYPNLYMSLRLGRGAPHPAFALDEGRAFKRPWVALLREFPDRFVLGTDFFHGPAGEDGRGVEADSLVNYRTALASLPRELAEAIAWRNAERIYRLQAER